MSSQKLKYTINSYSNSKYAVFTLIASFSFTAFNKMDAKTMSKSAIENTGKIIDLYGPRLCGSEAGHKAAAYLQKQLDEFCDSTKLESFKCHPDAFLGWVRMMDVVYVIGNVLCWLNLPIVATGFSFFACAAVFFEAFTYHYFNEKMYPEATGKNVYGIIEPKGEAKQTIIFSGHHDSAKRFGFYEFLPNLFLLRAAFGLLSTYVFFGICLFEDFYYIKSGVSLFSFMGEMPALCRKINIICSCFIPLVLSSWNFVRDSGVPGAGDNLISSCAAVELGKYFSKPENKLQNTRIVLMSFDGEEAGLRGSKAFWHEHAKEFTQIPCYNFNCDSLFIANELTVLLSDINGFEKYDAEFVQEVVKAAKQSDIHVNQKHLLFMLGGTDGAEATRHGAKATTIIGLPWTVGNYEPCYHTMLDTIDKIQPECVENVLTIAHNLFVNMDNKINSKQ